MKHPGHLHLCLLSSPLIWRSSALIGALLCTPVHSWNRLVSVWTLWLLPPSPKESRHEGDPADQGSFPASPQVRLARGGSFAPQSRAGGIKGLTANCSFVAQWLYFALYTRVGRVGRRQSDGDERSWSAKPLCSALHAVLGCALCHWRIACCPFS